MNTSRHITVYGKPGCHLCEIAYELACGLVDRCAIEKIDITSDARLDEKYHDKIPVMVVNERVTLFAPIRAQEIREALTTSTCMDA